MNIDLRKHGLLLKRQYNIDCCAPIACLHAIELLANVVGKRYTLSTAYVYYMARNIQGTGSQKCQLRSVFAALEKYGACSENTWPFDRHTIDTQPTDAAIFEGIHNRLHRYELVVDVKSYLMRDIPVIIGFSMGELFVSAPHEYKPVNDTDNKIKSSHGAVIVGMTDSGWILANSFGPAWGDKGYCILPYECSVDIGEMYAITSFAEIASIKNI